jgi:hypothetical protein
MKSTIIVLITILSLNRLQAQASSQQVANKIANKMKDSLSLSDEQKALIYNINIKLSNEKLAVRQSYAHSDSLQIKMQRVENTRDSLYKEVLTAPQLELYKKKKRNLVNNN